MVGQIEILLLDKGQIFTPNTIQVSDFAPNFASNEIFMKVALRVINRTFFESFLSRRSLFFLNSFCENVVHNFSLGSLNIQGKQKSAGKVMGIFRLVDKEAKSRVKRAQIEKHKRNFTALVLKFTHVFLTFRRPGRKKISLEIHNKSRYSSNLFYWKPHITFVNCLYLDAFK